MICKKCGKEHDGSFGSGKFCSRQCANSRTRSQELKEKVSKTLKQHYNRIGVYCKVCGKEISKNSKTGLCQKCLSSTEEYKELRKIAGKKAYKTMKDNGNFHGWFSRNIDSYPEKFFMNVLNNNEIQYQREKRFDKYFLDFFIIKNNKKIDLEIDGKQHEYEERKESDKIRDEFLKQNDVNIYRIRWNEINSLSGSQEMKVKIDNFLNFYNNL